MFGRAAWTAANVCLSLCFDRAGTKVTRPEHCVHLRADSLTVAGRVAKGIRIKRHGCVRFGGPLSADTGIYPEPSSPSGVEEWAGAVAAAGSSGRRNAIDTTTAAKMSTNANQSFHRGSSLR